MRFSLGKYPPSIGNLFQWPSLATSDVSSSILRERNKHLREQAGCNMGVFPNIIFSLLLYEVHSPWGRAFQEEDGTCGLRIFSIGGKNRYVSSIYMQHFVDE